MKNDIGLILEFAQYIGMFLLIPIGIILIAGLIRYNPKTKKVIMSIFSCIYNFIFGLLDTGVLFILGLNFLSNGIINLVGIASIIVYLLFFIPINIFMQKKGKIDISVYLAIMFAPKMIAIIIYSSFAGIN